MNSTACDVQVVEVAHEEANEMFDLLVRREMGMSGAAFLARWDANEYADVDFDEVPGLVQVWMYLPFVR